MYDLDVVEKYKKTLELERVKAVLTLQKVISEIENGASYNHILRNDEVFDTEGAYCEYSLYVVSVDDYVEALANYERVVDSLE